MIDDYSSKIKIAIFQSVSKSSIPNEGRSSNCCEGMAKIVHYKQRKLLTLLDGSLTHLYTMKPDYCHLIF